MGHLVDEKALQVERGGGIILAPQRALRVHPDVAVRRHDLALGVKGKPFAAVDPHRIIIDRIAEDRRGDVALVRAEPA